jgi:hypothetical protein
MRNPKSHRHGQSHLILVAAVVSSIALGWFLHDAYVIVRATPQPDGKEIFESRVRGNGCLEPIVTAWTTTEGLKDPSSSESSSEPHIPEFLGKDLVHRLIDTLRLANTVETHESVGTVEVRMTVNQPLALEEPATIPTTPLFELDDDADPQIPLKTAVVDLAGSKRRRAAHSVDFQSGPKPAVITQPCAGCISSESDSFDAPLSRLHQIHTLAIPNSESPVSSRLNVSQDKETPSPSAVQLGQTEDQVKYLFGIPQQLSFIGRKVVYTYERVRVTFVDGKVTDINQ